MTELAHNKLMQETAVPPKKRPSFLNLFSHKLVMTAELFSRNELANHAAAGSYGFLLSAAPAFLLAAVLLSRASTLSPEEALRFLSTFGGLGQALDPESLTRAYNATPLVGFAGLFAIVNLIWTARIFALSLQRGVRVVFSGQRSTPLRDNVLTFGIEFGALLYIFFYVMSSQLASMIGASNLMSAGLRSALSGFIKIIPLLGMGLLAYNAYRYLPSNRPRRRAALEGTIFCIAVYGVVALGFRYLVNSARYDLLYGSLGGMVVSLVNVYFFFTFFFWGAQLAFVTDSFDALIFSRFHRLKKSGSNTSSALERKLFTAPERLLGKFARSYQAGECLFTMSERSREVYYVLSGSVAICLPDAEARRSGKGAYGPDRMVAEILSGNFIGEMAYLLSEDRTASAYAKTDVVALKLPPTLFDEILKADPETARHIISSLSERLKKTNENLQQQKQTADSTASGTDPA